MAGTTRQHRGGDREAPDTPLELHKERLLGRIRRLLGRRARRRLDSHDVFQNVALEWARLPEEKRPRGPDSLLRWGTCVARNDVRDALRRPDPITVQGPEPIDSRAPSPGTRSGQREEVDRLVQAIAGLPEDHQRVIELRDLMGLSFREVAIEIDRSEAAAQMLHTRALARLGRRLRRGEE